MRKIFLFLSFTLLLLTACRFAPSPKTEPGAGNIAPAGGRLYQADDQPGIKTARLELHGGACTFNLEGTSAKLFTAATSDSATRFILSEPGNDSTHVVNFKMDTAGFTPRNHFGIPSVSMAMNPGPVWDIVTKTGAASLDLDLSAFKIRRCKVKIGVGACNIKLRPVLADMYVSIDVAMSNITISIPKDAACEVTSDTDLSNAHLDDLVYQDTGHYQTAGFNLAKNKIHIDVKLALSALQVKRF